MIDEFAIVPDIFDPKAYSNPAFIEMCLPYLKKLLLEEIIIRDLCDGEWSKFLENNSGSLHVKCKEILKKLKTNNRLRSFPSQSNTIPTTPQHWCQEGLLAHEKDALTGIIAGHVTKNQFTQSQVFSIEKLTGTTWWQQRSPSTTVNRKNREYLEVLHLLLLQANSLMFIDPNLNPSNYNYQNFHELIKPVASRNIKPLIEIHRSFCIGDGRNRTKPTENDWKKKFDPLSKTLESLELKAEVFLWDDFHDRYLTTDIVGIIVPAGFDTTTKDGWSTWGRLGRYDKDKIQRLFDPEFRKKDLKWRFLIGETGACQP